MNAGRALPWLLALAAGVREQTAPVPVAAANFVLATAAGERIALQADAGAHVLTVVAFLAHDDPGSQALATRLGALAREFAARRVRFLAVDAQNDAAPPAIDLPFPWLLDPLQAVADAFGVARAGQVVLLDAQFRRLAEGGGLDAPTLEGWLLGEVVPLPTLAADAREWRRAPAPTGDAAPTYHRDIAPLLARHCAECHRPGDIGPMAFDDPAQVRGDAPMIAEVTADGRMPPWHASPRVGHFSNERWLTETEKRLFQRFAEAGAPLGRPPAGVAPADPAPAPVTSAWAIGAPDLVVELPATQSIPAEGVVPYRYLPVDPKFDHDVWVSAIEVQPSNRAVTHHVGVFLLPPTQKDRVLNQDLLFAGAAPGGRPTVLEPGFAKKVAKGTRFLFQLHYTPNGTATTDRTRMALRFAREKVTHEVANWTIANPAVVLPPNAADVRFERTFPIPSKALITGLMPHMHYRGRTFRFDLARRDGTRTTLLDVPAYDFGWQHSYQLREPLQVDVGDKLVLQASYDNTAANRWNPDPTQTVRVGEQTDEEMMVGYVDYVKLAE